MLLIDDAQQLDPQAARLVRVLAAGTELALIAGDPNQAVFGFRGGEPAGLLAGDAPVGDADGVASLRSRRGARGQRHRQPAARRQRRQADRRHRDARTDRSRCVWPPRRTPRRRLIADTLRRAHLVDGVPWSQMAVIVRSVPRAGARLPRALAAAGVPVAIPAVGGSLSEEPAARRAAHRLGRDRRRARR